MRGAVNIRVYEKSQETAKAAAGAAAGQLALSIERQGHAVFMAATGQSQIEFLGFLGQEPNVDWSKTTMFHLDEYIGLPKSHPASFRRYLHERLINLVHPAHIHLIDGNTGDPEAECARLAYLLKNTRVDVAFVGIGENAHLAFNDPPADFDTAAPFIVVQMNEACRTQQVNEGWFHSVDEVPEKAITVSINQILKANSIICVVPGERKAQAVKCAFRGPVSPSCPASILRTHPNVQLFLDAKSSALLDRNVLKA